MTLCDGKVGKTYTIQEITIEEQNIVRRLEALGVNDLTDITILNKKKSSAFIIMVRGTRLAIGRHIAEGITIKETERHEE